MTCTIPCRSVLRSANRIPYSRTFRSSADIIASASGTGGIGVTGDDFDPLNIVGGMSPLAVKNMQAKEINQGRLAMVAVVAYVVQEAMTGEPVTSVSEQFFTPIIYYPWVQHLLTDAFGIASFRS